MCSSQAGGRLKSRREYHPFCPRCDCEHLCKFSCPVLLSFLLASCLLCFSLIFGFLNPLDSRNSEFHLQPTRGRTFSTSKAQFLKKKQNWRVSGSGKSPQMRVIREQKESSEGFLVWIFPSSPCFWGLLDFEVFEVSIRSDAQSSTKNIGMNKNFSKQTARWSEHLHGDSLKLAPSTIPTTA